MLCEELGGVIHQGGAAVSKELSWEKRSHECCNNIVGASIARALEGLMQVTRKIHGVKLNQEE